MRGRWLLALAFAPLFASACDLLESGAADRIPGRYRMSTYGGRPLPAVVQGEAGGARLELASAEMELRRNFSWVLVQQVDSVAGDVRRTMVVADSGRFRFTTVANELTFYTRDGAEHPATVAGDALDVFWKRARHDVFVR